jgi:hypothetical protein
MSLDARSFEWSSAAIPFCDDRARILHVDLNENPVFGCLPEKWLAAPEANCSCLRHIIHVVFSSARTKPSESFYCFLARQSGKGQGANSDDSLVLTSIVHSRLDISLLSLYCLVTLIYIITSIMDIPTRVENDTRNKVKVLTAGGAASSILPSSLGSKQRSRKKKSSRQQQQQQQQKSQPQEYPQQQFPQQQRQAQNVIDLPHDSLLALEYEAEEDEHEQDRLLHDVDHRNKENRSAADDPTIRAPYRDSNTNARDDAHLYDTGTITSLSKQQHHTEVIWLAICFLGIMASFVCYGLLLEYTTSGGRQLHELSFLFVTSGLYTLTAAAGRYVRDETPSTIPPARFAILGLTSMGSTFCSVRSLRYVKRALLPVHHTLELSCLKHTHKMEEGIVGDDKRATL